MLRERETLAQQAGTRVKRWLQYSVRAAVRPRIPNAQMAHHWFCLGIESIMTVSWSDLNNVQQAGDYSFRDGTITVTFAEVAIWKNNPNAQFQLMRKHPIRGAPGYVLGRRVEGELASDISSLIYQSSNGDIWSLTKDPATGASAVMHSPNPQSGGKVSYVEIEKFLSEGANGPEHQALRNLIETSAGLATLLIAYDIHPTEGEGYDNLIETIQSLGAWWHHLESTWIVRCARSPREIRDQLKSHIGTNDQLLVIEISGDTAEWTGVNDAGSRWLQDNI
jgi:hypothetical protein